VAHARTSVGPLTIDELYLAGQVDVRPDPLHTVIVIWPAGGRVAGRCGELDTAAAADDVALMTQPHLPYRARSDELRGTLVLLDPALVAGVATGLPSSQAPLPIRFLSLTPLDAAAAWRWKKAAAYVIENVLSDDSLATPLVIGHASRLLAAVTVGTFPNTATSSSTPHDRTDHQPVLLRRAMEFIDTNAGSDIALADIAEAVHVTPRAVQYMFRRHLETTPLQHLRRMRLHYARQELLSADRETSTVTEIAARWGFAHTGRFAVLYRRTYGQSPHTTLRS
jgi:AraC-like DNA-binding protein